MARTESFGLAILLSAKGAERTTRQLRGVRKEVSTLGAIGQHASRGLSTAASNLAKLGAVAAGLGAAAGIQAVRWAADFEAQLNTINTIARETPEGLQRIGDQIRAVARETGTPLEELTQGYYDLLSAGIKAADAADVLRAANTLAIGGLATTAETIDLLTTAINTYGGDASQAARDADIFAKAIENGKMTASDLAASFATVGPIASQAGIELEEIGAAYAQLTALGVPATETATQMRSAIVALMRRTGDLEKLEKKTGKSYLAIAGKKGLVVALQQLRRDAEKNKIPLIDLLGRVEGLNFVFATTGPNFADYNRNLEQMQESAGTAALQMGERQQGLNYQLGRLRANVQDAGITIGTKLLPVLADLTDKMVAFISTHQDDIARFGDDLAKALQDAVDWASKLDWDKIGDGLRVAADWAGKLIGAFTSMPPEVQGTILALAGLDKLSGGAITAITTELAKGLIRGVLGLNAAVVNLNAGVVRGGGAGGGTIVGGGGGRGLLGGLARTGALIGGGALLLGRPTMAENRLDSAAGAVAGGALAGFGLGGPLGGIAGGLAGFVEAVREGFAQNATDQARALRESLGSQIETMRPADLQSALGGVEEGIRQLQSNPLLVLVQGDALTELQQMRDALKSELAKRQQLPDHLQRVGETIGRDTSRELQRLHQIPTKLGEIGTKVATIPGALSQVGPKVATAIGAMPPPRVNVSITAQITNQVRVSYRELMSAQHVVARIGRMVAV